jgi:hypothetical protein
MPATIGGIYDKIKKGMKIQVYEFQNNALYSKAIAACYPDGVGRYYGDFFRYACGPRRSLPW